MVLANHFEGFPADPHGDIDDQFDAAFIHDSQHAVRILGIEMVVVVNDWKSGAPHLVLRNDEHGAGMVIAEPQVHGHLGGDHLDESIFARHVFTHGSLQFASSQPATRVERPRDGGCD